MLTVTISIFGQGLKNTLALDFCDSLHPDLSASFRPLILNFSCPDEFENGNLTISLLFLSLSRGSSHCSEDQTMLPG